MFAPNPIGYPIASIRDKSLPVICKKTNALDVASQSRIRFATPMSNVKADALMVKMRGKKNARP